jgi:hypothetical protein
MCTAVAVTLGLVRRLWHTQKGWQSDWRFQGQLPPTGEIKIGDVIFGGLGFDIEVWELQQQ